jgi:hypothetical protein
MMEYADQLERESADSGVCEACGQHIDDGCECSEQEREDSFQGCECSLSASVCTC